MTFRSSFGTCLFPIVTHWQRHLIPIYLTSQKAQVTTCKHVNTHDRTQDNCSLQENGGANHHDHFPIGRPALTQFSDFKCYLKCKTETVMQINTKG